ncbi:Hok/Gef family protein [[Erwinia] mediterraneensis]|uniref:Hok/Gef family protein n=1 Tax=[Erwinia] mediterraneensis TaxID=2161819 RepID=UPI0010304B78|nr:Hok/Gef family protein [[Erwinia] mediterraneensis]
MKQQRAILIVTVVLAITFAVILATRKNLCEVRIRTGFMEIAAFMAYESIK